MEAVVTGGEAAPPPPPVLGSWGQRCYVVVTMREIGRFSRRKIVTQKEDLSGSYPGSGQ